MLARLPAAAFEPGPEGRRQQGRGFDRQHRVTRGTASVNRASRTCRGPPFALHSSSGCLREGAYANANSGAGAPTAEGATSWTDASFSARASAGTVIRLVLLSIVVGIVFSALGITLFNIVERLQQLVRNIINLGFDAFHSAFQYFLLGVVVVVPIWFVMRLLSRPRDPKV